MTKLAADAFKAELEMGVLVPKRLLRCRYSSTAKRGSISNLAAISISI